MLHLNIHRYIHVQKTHTYKHTHIQNLTHIHTHTQINTGTHTHQTHSALSLLHT